MANKTIEMTMLFDFFGDLLTNKQREYFNYYYNDDLSLSEIAEIAGISRQGVRDAIVKAENALIEFEDKTGVFKRFSSMQKRIAELEKIAKRLKEVSVTDEQIALSSSLYAGLNDLKG